MQTFSTLLAICEGDSPVMGEFPSQRSVMRSFDIFFDLRPNNDWDVGNLRRHLPHHDVTIMTVWGMHLSAYAKRVSVNIIC